MQMLMLVHGIGRFIRRLRSLHTDTVYKPCVPTIRSPCSSDRVIEIGVRQTILQFDIVLFRFVCLSMYVSMCVCRHRFVAVRLTAFDDLAYNFEAFKFFLNFSLNFLSSFDSKVLSSLMNCLSQAVLFYKILRKVFDKHQIVRSSRSKRVTD